MKSGSPTPRKPIFPPAPYGPNYIVHQSMVDLQHHPQPLRHPSSSMFQKPFVRSLSRASLAYADLDPQSADNGSFQLKGFRHVSGTSVDSPGGLDEYLSRLKRDQADDGGDDPPYDTPETPAPHERHPVFNTQSARPGLSRPPSVAASIGSVEDSVTASGRVSVAAFRKGIRRPSEGPGTMSDLGHGGFRDDDDIPLGLLPRRDGGSRAQSSASLSSLRSRVEDPPDISPQPSPTLSPSLAFTVRRHNRNGGGSGGFIVKSAKTTRTMPQSVEDERSVSGKYTPRAIVAASVSTTSVRPLTDYEEIVKSPISTPVDNYFSVQAPITTSIQRDLPAPLSQLRTPDPAFVAEAIKAPSSGASPGRAPPPVEPLSLPQPGDMTPSSFGLPLPPDQMPDTPPRQYQDLASSSRVPTSPGRSRTLSLLDEPMRLFSGLWSGSLPADGSAVEYTSTVNATRTQGNVEDSLEPPIKPIPRPLHRATLSDTNAILSDERGRSSLQSRLAMAASGLSRATPALLVIENYGIPDGSKAERIQSPTSDSGTASPVAKSCHLISESLPHAPRAPVKPHLRATSARKSKEGWSSGASEDETEGRHKLSSSRRVPSGPRRLSTRKRDESGNGQAMLKHKRIVSTDGMSSEDESLSALREKASRSSLSLASLSKQSSSLPATTTSPVSLLGMKPNSSEIPPVPIIPMHHQARMPSQSSHQSMRPPTESRSPGPVLDHLPDLSANQIHRLTASPASSQSGITSDSVGRHPVTPNEQLLPPTTQLKQMKAGVYSRVNSGDSDPPELEPVCVPSNLEKQKLTPCVGYVCSACTSRRTVFLQSSSALFAW